MNTDKIDVLAVMKRDAAAFSQMHFLHQNRPALEDMSANARAAVAELIAAGNEYDAAMRSEADTDGMLRRETARTRLRAALALIRGAA